MKPLKKVARPSVSVAALAGGAQLPKTAPRAISPAKQSRLYTGPDTLRRFEGRHFAANPALAPALRRFGYDAA
jgi:hypothetical protein